MMNRKRYILTAIALTIIAVSTPADTNKLLEADGWSKITSLPTATDLANNYYVFVDNTQDLMLGIAKGVNQNTKWYSLGVFYQTSVEPASADMNGKTWIVEPSGNGYSLRNLEYSAQPMMTEWNAAWKFDTNDIYLADGNWTVTTWNYADGSWTIQNGKYPSSGYLGPWTDSNFANGAECAANKTGNNVGHFQIYAISRAQYRQNLIDNASESNPVDVTPWYVNNATFDAKNRNGWTEEGSGGNNNTSVGCEIWHRSGFRIYQNVTPPNGKYKVSLQIAGSIGAGQVYGTSGSNTQTALSSAAAGSDFEKTVLAMIQDRTYGRVTTDEIEVANNSLQIGMKCETTDQWLVFDNFKLYCTGVDLSAYQSQLSGLVSECEDFVASAVIPNACETIINEAVSTYNQDYATAKEYSAAIIALTAVLDSYRNDAELQKAYADYYAFRSKVMSLSTGQPASEALSTFTSAVSKDDNAVDAATSSSDIASQKTILRSDALSFISSVSGSFDITFLASQNYGDWKKKDGSAAGEVTWAVSNRGDWTFAESYEETCATTGTILYQTVSDLPSGFYQVGMYAMAAYTSGRGFETAATEGDANCSFAFAGDLNDASTILRTGIPIPFKSSFDFSELTTLDVNVHLAAGGNLSFGVQKDSNGSNWHFAQIASIVYSKDPDLTSLQATRDALIAEAQGIFNTSAYYLTDAQQESLLDAITAGNEAITFDELNAVTLNTLPNAINTANQQISLVKTYRSQMVEALQRFENDYNLADGTDYRRLTMSAEAWTSLITKVNAVTTALDDISFATTYGTVKNELVAQMDATDASLRLFKSYQAMSEGVRSLLGGEADSSETDNDDSEQTAIGVLNEAFDSYMLAQDEPFNVSAFLGENLDFSQPQGDVINTDNSNAIYAVTGWEVDYADADTWAVVQNQHPSYPSQLYIRKNWGSSATTLTANKQKMLPAGKYKLALSWNSTMENMTNLSSFSLGNNVTAIGEATNGAKKLTYEFSVDEPTAFDLVIGFQKTGTGNTPAQLIVDDVTLTCLPTTITLYDNADNSETLSAFVGQRGAVTIHGRTLYKDAAWNTLCLPFDMTEDQVAAQLNPSALMTLDAETPYHGHVTGIEDNTLYLNFKATTSIDAGKPYLIKWETDDNIVNPRFMGVVVGGVSQEPIYSNDGSVAFVGTYNPVDMTANDKTRLMLGTSNNLYWPTVNMVVGAFRAYFQLSEEAEARAIELNFGEETVTAIDGCVSVKDQPAGNTYYTLDGRMLPSAPTMKGVYIHNNRKVIIK
ncbi:MAG: hypothetical protein IJS97_07790 [Prevotella sp.]|nr:hypothetical protein [Prevotella sp.]